MALNQVKGEVDSELYQRFQIAASTERPDDHADRVLTQMNAQGLIIQVAEYLVENVAPGRELSLALTKLEEALMWAGKAIFR